MLLEMEFESLVGDRHPSLPTVADLDLRRTSFLNIFIMMPISMDTCILANFLLFSDSVHTMNHQELIDAAKAFDLLFASASNFNFLISANISNDELEGVLCRTIGTLPTPTITAGDGRVRVFLFH